MLSYQSIRLKPSPFINKKYCNIYFQITVTISQNKQTIIYLISVQHVTVTSDKIYTFIYLD